MPTLIEPNELAGLNVSTYFKMLNKDLAKLSRVGKNQPFVYFRDFKLAGKKIPLILFVDPSKEKEWDAVLNKIPKENFKKQATGIARISIEPDDDGNGKDDVQIKIKKCEGISKADVASEIKNGWFAKDPDVEVRTAKDDEADETDEEQDNEVKTQIENQSSTQTDKLDELDYETVEKAQVNKEFKHYLAEVRATVGMIGGANEFQAGIKTKLQEFAQAKPSTADEKLEFIKAVKTYDSELDEKMNHLSETVILGNKMLKKQESFLKAIFKAQEYQTSRAQISEHIANLTRLLQFAAKANDYLDNVLVGKNEATKDVAEASKLLSADVPEEKLLLEAIAVVPTLPTNPTLQDLQQKYKALESVYLAAEKVMNASYAKKEKVDRKTQKELYEQLNKKQSDANSYLTKAKSSQEALQIQMTTAAGDSISQAIITEATKNGIATPDNVFTAFMAYFKGKFSYNPRRPKAKLLSGVTVGDCESVSNALVEVMRKADSTWSVDTAPLHGRQKVVCGPIDANWLDNQCPGNFQLGGKKYYYFNLGHVIVKANGKSYCPTTSLTGGAAETALAAGVETNKPFTMLSKTYQIEDKPDGEYRYTLTEL